MFIASETTALFVQIPSVSSASPTKIMEKEKSDNSEMFQGNADSGIKPVMVASSSWPLLSEAAKAASCSSSDSLKSLCCDGSSSSVSSFSKVCYNWDYVRLLILFLAFTYDFIGLLLPKIDDYSLANDFFIVFDYEPEVDIAPRGYSKEKKMYLICVNLCEEYVQWFASLSLILLNVESALMLWFSNAAYVSLISAT